MPITERWAYLSHSLRGPLPARAAGRLTEVAGAMRDDGAAARERFAAETTRARSNVARLLGGRADAVSFTRNTSEALSLVANGLRLGAGDRVVCCDLEYPANIYPWLNLRSRGVEVAIVACRDGRVAIDDLAAELARGARVLAISHVQFTTGYRSDLAALAALCREHDALLVVDAVQSLGSVRIAADDWGVRVIAADARKWLLGPDGVGLLYCHPSVYDRIDVTVVGAMSVRGARDYLDYDLTLLPDGRRFESGALNTAGTVALAASTDLLLEVGIEAIERRVLALGARLIAGLERLGGVEVISPRACDAERSGIVGCRIAPDRARALREALAARAVQCRAGDDGLICLSPHFYNSEAEIDRALEVIGEHARL